MQTVTVVTLGPGNPNYLTRQAEKALREARHLILRTSRHRTADWLRDEGIAFTDFDALYDRYDSFDELHRAMAEALWLEAERHPVTFAVQDAITDGAVRCLRETQPDGASLRVIPGISASDVALAEAGIVGDGWLIVPASDIGRVTPDPEWPLLVTEIDDRILAGEVKLHLAALYGDEAPVLFCPSTAKTSRKPSRITLCELDRQPAYDHTVCAVLPPAGLTDRDRYGFEDLVRIMARLRGEGGCPWDSAQTHQSLRKYLLEEAYEAAGAIDEDDMAHLADELGDVLLQIVFHADIGRSSGEFDITDVTSAICRKMIRRHTHIFGEDRCETADQVSDNWERIKREERHQRTQSEVLRDVSKALPALTRAAKVQKKAAQVGFDWDTAAEALPKVTEEAAEVQEELAAARDPSEELGDLLFACVNVARLAGCDPEEVLTAATEKFIRRFTRMEEAILRDNKDFKGLTLAEMDVYWNRIKHDSETR
ncbi:MAG: nucleoside triphosphate pyrophosphohydrolase [Clostridia bacterium]|nr:nucleoside triphosphate pyrophosphohydrolase [Clostridia bacterium]